MAWPANVASGSWDAGSTSATVVTLGVATNASDTLVVGGREGGSGGTCTLDVSYDNGSTWTTITGVASNGQAVTSSGQAWFFYQLSMTATTNSGSSICKIRSTFGASQTNRGCWATYSGASTFDVAAFVNNGATTSNTTSTGSISPSGSRLMVAFGIDGRNSGVQEFALTPGTSNGLTWTDRVESNNGFGCSCYILDSNGAFSGNGSATHGTATFANSATDNSGGWTVAFSQSGAGVALSGGTPAQALASSAVALAVAGGSSPPIATAAAPSLDLATGGVIVAAQAGAIGGLTVGFAVSIVASASSASAPGQSLVGAVVTQATDTAAPQLALVGNGAAGAVVAGGLVSGQLQGSVNGVATATGAQAIIFGAGVTPQGSVVATSALQSVLGAAAFSPHASAAASLLIGLAGAATGSGTQIAGPTVVPMGAAVAQASAAATLTVPAGSVALSGSISAQGILTPTPLAAIYGGPGLYGVAQYGSVIPLTFLTIGVAAAVSVGATLSQPGLLIQLPAVAVAAQAGATPAAQLTLQLAGTSASQAATASAPTLLLPGAAAGGAQIAAPLPTRANALTGAIGAQASVAGTVSISSGAALALSGQVAPNASAVAQLGVLFAAVVTSSAGVASAPVLALAAVGVARGGAGGPLLNQVLMTVIIVTSARLSGIPTIDWPPPVVVILPIPLPGRTLTDEPLPGHAVQTNPSPTLYVGVTRR